MYFRQQEKNELMHHGIKGQKWGVRRYQNEDGSLTPEGRKRYSDNRQGHGNYYHDLRETAKMDLFYEKGNGNIKAGERAYKQEWENKRNEWAKQVKEARRDPSKTQPEPIESYQRYIEDLITSRALSNYSDLDEAKRDAYAWLTEKAIKQNTGSAFAPIGVFDLNANEYKRRYEYYDSVVRNKKK